MFFDPGLQANVEVQLVFLVVACPRHFFKAIGLCVDELGVLRDRLVGVPVNNNRRKKTLEQKSIW